MTISIARNKLGYVILAALVMLGVMYTVGEYRQWRQAEYGKYGQGPSR